jgi:glycosyltransferase involved in cell wall biosynthesis
VRHMKRVAHVTSAHSAKDIRIFHKECVTLSKAGYHVTLIAPNREDAIVSGVRIVSIPFAGTRASRLLRSVPLAFKKCLQVDAEVYHLHDPELLPIGLALRLLGKKVIYDAHENVGADILGKTYLPSCLRKPLSWLAGAFEAAAKQWFTGIVAATPGIAQHLKGRRTVVVNNYVMLEDACPPRPFRLRMRQAIYTGVISVDRGIFEMVRAIALLNENHNGQVTELVIAGEFSPPNLREAVSSERGWRYVHYVGVVDHAAIRDLLSSARVALLLLHPTENYYRSCPTKLFEYLAAGIPTVMSNFPYWRGLLDSRCGLFVDQFNPMEISESIRWLLCHPEEAEEMGRRGHAAAVDRFSWTSQAQVLEKFYETYV